jgi:hypothetical protein
MAAPEAREHDPDAPVGRREPQPPRSSALQHLQLVPSRQDFELEGGARVRRCSQGLENGQERRHHRPEAYLRSAAPSTPATRTDFSAGTDVPVEASEHMVRSAT